MRSQYQKERDEEQDKIFWELERSIYNFMSEGLDSRVERHNATLAIEPLRNAVKEINKMLDT